MEKVEVHFIHGFLGSGRDWQRTISALPPNFKINCYDLVSDFIKLASAADSFNQWAENMQQKITGRRGLQVIVGYSLGGRLAMHLNPKSFDRAILVASHPGLKEGHANRKQGDHDWSQRMLNQDWQQWLEEWNKQEVFNSDRYRPNRADAEIDRNVWSDILQKFSLADQQVMDQKLSAYREKFYWLYGKQDLKYTQLKDRMERALGPEHIIEVDSAGHGVPFDNPDRLAQIIIKVVQDAQ